MYEEITIYLSAVSTLASVIQALPVIIGARTTTKENGNGKTKHIKIAQGLLWFAAFIAALPTLVPVLLFYQSSRPFSGTIESYKYDSADLYRIGWAIFLVCAAYWLNNFKNDSE